MAVQELNLAALQAGKQLQAGPSVQDIRPDPILVPMSK
jgi:hypothetical protein